MKLRNSLKSKRLVIAGGAAVAVLACATPTVRQGDLLRVTPTDGSRVQGSLLASGPDSIAIAAAGGVVSVARDSIERVEFDARVRSRWVRFYECANVALHAGWAVSAIRSQDATRAAIFGVTSGVVGWKCLQPHSWVRARLPNEARPPSAVPDSASPGR